MLQVQSDSLPPVTSRKSGNSLAAAAKTAPSAQAALRTVPDSLPVQEVVPKASAKGFDDDKALMIQVCCCCLAFAPVPTRLFCFA